MVILFKFIKIGLEGTNMQQAAILAYKTTVNFGGLGLEGLCTYKLICFIFSLTLLK